MIGEEDIPDHWELETIEDVSEIILGNSPPGESYNESGNGIPFIQGASAFDEFHPNTSRFTSEPTKLCQEGDTIIAIRATIGDLNKADKEYCLGRGVAAVRSGERINQEFVHKYLETVHRIGYWEEVSTGATFNSISKTNIQELAIPAPPLDEQERIVSEIEEQLSVVETLENSVNRVDDVSGEYEKSLLAFLLTGGSEEGVENFGVSLKDNHVPDGWEVKEVRDVVSAKNGGTPSRSEEQYWDGDIEWLSSGEIRGKYTSSAEEGITEAALEKTSAKIFPENSVLVAMYGSGTRGRSTIIPKRMSGNQAICCLEPNEEVNPEYLLYFYKGVKERLADKARGAAQKNLNQSMVIDEKIPIPSLSRQEEIVNQIEKVDFTTIEKSSKDLRTLFSEYEKSILSNAFTGDLDY